MKNDTFKIRFNTASKTESFCWRIIDSENNEKLVHGINILVPCLTTRDWIEEIKDYKYHMTCRGRLLIEDDFAFIVSTNN